MPRISINEGIQHLYNAGFRGADLVRATAVVSAESGFKTDAVSWTGCCVGLMQINTEVHRQWSAAEMKDPAANTKAGFSLFQASGWKPWNSSRAGQALYSAMAATMVARFMATNPVQTAGDVAGSAVGSAAGSVANATGIPQAIDTLGAIRRWTSTPANWLRVAYVVSGIALTIGALIVLSKPIIEPAVKTAVKVAR